MKILLVTHTFLPKYVAGTEVYTYGLAKEFGKNNTVDIFTTDPLNKHNDYRIIKTNYDDLIVYSLRKNIKENHTFENTYNDPKTIKPFKKLLTEIKPDIIHYQHIMHLTPDLIKVGHSLKIPQIITLNDFWFQTMLFNRITSQEKLMLNYSDEGAASDLANIFGVGFFSPFRKSIDTRKLIKSIVKKIFYKIFGKIIYFFEKREYLEKIKLRNSLMRKSLETADLVIFPTVFMYQEFTKWGFKAKKAIISSHGINTEIFKHTNKTKNSVLRFGFIGSIIPSKGLDILLKAWSKVSGPNIQLKVYGNLDTNKKYKKEIMKLRKNCKNIKFLGTFFPNKIAYVFSEIDVLIIPSRWFENAPLVLRNALVSHTPVIATNLGSLVELVKERDSGLLFENENADDLAEKINIIINDRGALSSFKFPKQKNVEENAEELNKIYKNFIKNNEK